MYTIITVITNQSLPRFQEEVKKFCEGKTIVRKREGVSLIPIMNGGNHGVMPLPYAFIVHECTETEHKAWKQGQIILT